MHISFLASLEGQHGRLEGEGGEEVQSSENASPSKTEGALLCVACLANCAGQPVCLVCPWYQQQPCMVM